MLKKKKLVIFTILILNVIEFTGSWLLSMVWDTLLEGLFLA